MPIVNYITRHKVKCYEILLNDKSINCNYFFFSVLGTRMSKFLCNLVAKY